ncbi:MAG: alanine dehydrogenase [Fusobacterium sp. JB021]|nr:alanine dehydrogenase [Fusobacterium sp. JB020]MDP0493848.1 alanine dehydrogenase [Fusobacterium sp. JB021]MDP0506520.1 alanine dehydrogenase [Fusobacterium sp. JB019]MDP0506523.1 alanine dehydrogenase [Fusobacterium sp. JB019]
MKIGIPKEKKNNENRVGLTDAGVGQLVLDGNEVYVQKGAGLGVGVSDEDYISSGAVLVETTEEIFEKAELIIKVERPLECERKLLKPHHILYGYLHLAADKESTEELVESGATCIGYETIVLPDGSIPLLSPMSEVAGKMAVQVGGFYLQKTKGGKGIVLGGVPGVERGRVVVLGAGAAGQSAIKTAVGLGAEVIAIDINTNKLRYLDDVYKSQVTTLYSTPRNIEEAVASADLLIGTVLIPGGKTPRLVTKKYINSMGKGSVIVDVAIDQGGCFETSKVTSHEKPIYCVNGVLHYCVSNMAGAYPITSTLSLENASLKYARAIANYGLKAACGKHPELVRGINIMNQRVTCRKVADSLEMDYVGVGF